MCKNRNEKFAIVCGGGDARSVERHIRTPQQCIVCTGRVIWEPIRCTGHALPLDTHLRAYRTAVHFGRGPKCYNIYIMFMITSRPGRRRWGGGWRTTAAVTGGRFATAGFPPDIGAAIDNRARGANVVVVYVPYIYAYTL